jgi:hypothetical protein
LISAGTHVGYRAIKRRSGEFCFRMRISREQNIRTVMPQENSKVIDV